MSDSVEFSCQVLQATIHIIYGDITQMETDVIVSSDDVYLSMSGGVSAAISRAAGSALREDARKHQLPLPLGWVTVTGAGLLKAKYVFHATTLDFATVTKPDVLITQIVQRVMNLCTALGIKRIALPLLGSGLAGLPKDQVLKFILWTTAFHLVSQNSSLREVSIVLRKGDDVRSVIEEFSRQVTVVTDLQNLIEKIRILREALSEDSELCDLLVSRIALAEKKLCTIFHFPALDQGIDLQESTPLDAQGYEEARTRLQNVLKKLNEEADNITELQLIYERRLKEREKSEALQGLSTPPEVRIEIEDLHKSIEQGTTKLQRIEDQRAMYKHEIESLRYK